MENQVSAGDAPPNRIYETTALPRLRRIGRGRRCTLVGAPSLSIEPQVIPAQMEFGRVTTWTIEGGKVRVVIENTNAKMDALQIRCTEGLSD